jgi:hypothetical protein
LASNATPAMAELAPVIVKFTSSNPMVLPVLSTSVSWRPKFVPVKVTLFTVTAATFSVVVALCALATAGSTRAPVPPRTIAAAIRG